MTILALLSGLLIGLSLGALGGGGSILTVPALVYLLGQSAHDATGASLIVVGIAAVVGAVTHARAGRVASKAGAAFGVLGIAGSYLGSRASAAVPADVLLAGFAVLMLAAAAAMIVRRHPRPRPRGAVDGAPAGAAGLARPGLHRNGGAVPDGQHAPDAQHGLEGTGGGRVATLPATAPAGAPSPAGRRAGMRRGALVAAAATGVGLITGFFGVGGGFVIVPVLVLVLGFDMATAVGTSLLVIAIDSAAALGARIGHGALSLDWTVVGLFTVAAVIGALFGGKAAGRVNPQRLSTAFTGLIIVLAVYTLARSIPGLV